MCPWGLKIESYPEAFQRSLIAEYPRYLENEKVYAKSNMSPYHVNNGA
jgi:hypothetical protein